MPRTNPSLDAFSGWLNRVLKHFKDTRKWGITRVAEESKVPRSALTRWRDGNWSSGRPTKEVVQRFCENLGLTLDEPFSYFGWDPAGPGAPVVPDPLPRPPLGKIYETLLEMRYETPDLTPDEEELLDAQIELAVELLKRRRERRLENGPEGRSVG